MWVLVAATIVGLTAAGVEDCPTLLISPGSCVDIEFPMCVSECKRLRFNVSCSDTPGCSWDGAICHTENVTLPAICSAQSSIEDCSNAGCSWETQTCLGIRACQPRPSDNNETNLIPCDGTRNATSCAERGSQCQMKNSCSDDPCARFEDRSSCTEVAGCFWGEVTTTAQNFTEAMSWCASCFADPIVNEYSVFQSLVGLSCTRPGQVMSFMQAFAATSGCDGGMPMPTIDYLSLNGDGSDVVCVPISSAPTTPMPTLSPTTLMPTLSTLMPTLSPTLSPSTLMPTLSPSTLMPTLSPTLMPSTMPSASGLSSAPTPKGGTNDTVSVGGRLAVSHAVLAGVVASALFFLA